MEDVDENLNDASSSSSDEEVHMASELTDSQKKALQELKKLIQDGLQNNQLISFVGDQATIWGVPLLGDKRSDIIILKFLKATNFEVLGAYGRINNTLLWRNKLGIESLFGEDDLENNVYKKLMFAHGYDKEGHPVWYLVLEDALDDNLSLFTSSDEQKQQRFLRWLIQFTERNIRKLVFSRRGTHSILLVIDLKSLTRYGNRNMYKVIYKFLQLLHDHYPQFLAKQLWINVSWWYRCYCRAYSMVFDVWSTNQIIVFSGQSKTIDTLFKYISPAQVPVNYGGLSKEKEQDLCQSSTDDIVSEVTIKPASTHREEYLFMKPCGVLWELRMISWDAIYEAKFEPYTDGNYITNITRPRKLTSSDEPVISEGFRVYEPGKLVLIIHNTSSRKKKLLLRVRVKSFDHNIEPEPSLRGWLAD